MHHPSSSVLLLLWLASAIASAAAVRLTVAEPSGVARKGWPVTSGIPFAQGALRDHQASALFDADGSELPLQTEALAKWPDGSVRWLLLDFQVDLAPKENKALSLRYGAAIERAAVERPVQARADAAGVTLVTGPLRVELPRKGFDLLGAVWLDADGDGTFAPVERVTESRGIGITLGDGESPGFYSSSHDGAGPAEIVVEQAGPLRACVRVAGSHASDKGRKFRYVVRIHAFRGQPFLRLHYTFINDQQDAVMAKLRGLYLGVYLASKRGVRHTVLAGKAGLKSVLFQADESHAELNGRAAGKRAAGWAAIAGDRAGLAVGVREFWQNWPKSLELASGPILAVGICPQFPKGRYDGKPTREENKLYYYLRDGVYTFKVGVAKTHELWANFFAGPPDLKKLSAFFKAAEDPLLATCEPAYVSGTKALGEFPPADQKKYAGYDAQVEKALADHLRRRDRGREYGMLNYGDWYGERRVNWGNLEYDLAHGLFIQYLRTGDRRFFLRAEQAARHHIDVDVVHATNKHLKNPWGAPPRVGEIWLHCLNHTGGYYDEKTSGLPVSRTYHVGHSTNFGHVWVTGDLDYYYLTGDRRAREVALQMADAMVRHMPTRYGTHIRALGWPMILVLAAYEATGDKKYLDAAIKNWLVLKKNIDWKRGWVIRLAKGHCLHPTRQCFGNVPFMEGQTCSALARYHRITKDPEVLRAISAGIDQMIRECWQEDVKTFRYTACPLSSKAPYVLFLLSAEAMAYELAHAPNKDHARVLREGLRMAIQKSAANGNGKSLGQTLFFTPHGLGALEN